jgi:hypothetical protein
MTVLKTMEVDFDSTGGDSGGPLFYTVPGGGTTNRIALGTHVHSDPDGTPNAHGWYSPIDTGRDTYNALWGYSYTMCFTSAC